MDCYRIIRLMMLVLLSTFFVGTAAAESRHTFAAQGDVAFFKEDGKIGLQTASGDILHAAEFDGAGYFDATQQASVYIGNKVGRIDRLGHMVVEPFECDSIQAIPTDLVEEGAPLYVLLVSWCDADGQKTMQLMNTEGEWLSETQFDLMMYEFHNGRLFIRNEGRFNQIDAYGQLTSEEWWDDLFVNIDNEAYAYVSQGEALYFTPDEEIWRKVSPSAGEGVDNFLISESQAYLMPESWTRFTWINDQFVAYSQDNLWGVTDYQGNIVLPANWASADIVNLEMDIWRVRDSVTGKMKWIHSSGETVLELAPDERWHYISDDRYAINGDKSSRLIDNTGATVAEFDSKYYLKYGEENDYVRYINTTDDTWGFISRNGDLLCEIPDSYYEYRDGYIELTNGWFRVIDEERGYWFEKTGQCGFVNVDGKMLLSSEWGKIRDFSRNALACVEVDEKYGYIDDTGEYAIQPQWEFADDFMDVGDQWIACVYQHIDADFVWQGYINESNELVGETILSAGMSAYADANKFSNYNDFD